MVIMQQKNLNLNPLDDMWGGKIKTYLICMKGSVVPQKSNIVQCQFPAHPPVHKGEKNGKKDEQKSLDIYKFTCKLHSSPNQIHLYLSRLKYCRSSIPKMRIIKA
jgi:hypothetical protein